MKKILRFVIPALLIGTTPAIFSKNTPPPQFTNTAQDFYSNILKAFQKKDWRDLIFNARCLFNYFPNSPFASEASYYEGVAFYVIHDYDFKINRFQDT